MNLQTLPMWAYLVIAALAFILAKRKGWLDAAQPSPKDPADASPKPTANASPAAQVVELRHVVGPSPAAGTDASVAANPLTQTRRVNVGLDVAVTPVAEKVP